jgi:hypothetical protein
MGAASGEAADQARWASELAASVGCLVAADRDVGAYRAPGDVGDLSFHLGATFSGITALASLGKNAAKLLQDRANADRKAAVTDKHLVPGTQAATSASFSLERVLSRLITHAGPSLSDADLRSMAALSGEAADQARWASELAASVGCLVAADRDVGVYRAPGDVGDLLFHLGATFSGIAALASLGKNAAELLQDRVNADRMAAVTGKPDEEPTLIGGQSAQVPASFDGPASAHALFQACSQLRAAERLVNDGDTVDALNLLPAALQIVESVGQVLIDLPPLSAADPATATGQRRAA